jgi:TP901 family phage tail tape measure protein
MSNIFVRLLLNTDKFDQGLFKTQKNMRGFAATTQGVFGGLTKFASYAGAFVGISTSIHSAVTANMEFEKSLSSLRALTGVSADELNYFRIEAIRMGMDSTQSAKQMVDAFKLIGSQMPELLKNKTALTQTAEAAVVLAEAAELDVPTAAKALTGALNQMGASSAEATDYINILAAASQQGSADIPYLNKAIENAGGAASSTGVKFNELVAIIEAIAPKITDAASAGTNLRNIFLTLESSADQNLRPSVVGLSKAIDNLSKKNLDAVQLTKMFGKESVTAAIAILQEKDTFDQLSESIQGTNTAYDQARINNDNLAGSIGKLQSAWTSFINTMAGSNGYIQNAVDNLREMVNWATRAIAMTEDQRFKDTNKGKVSEAVKQMDLYVSQGMDPELARKRTMADLTRTLFPDAQFMEKYKRQMVDAQKAWEKAKLVNINSAAYEEEKVFKEAKRLYELSVEQKSLYDLIDNTLQKQVTSLEQQRIASEQTRKETEAAAEAAQKKAEAEEKARQEKEKASRPEGSLADLEYQIRKQQQNLMSATTNEARTAVQKTINELEARKIFLKAQVETTLFQTGRKAPEAVTGSSMSLGDLAGGVKIPDKIKLPSVENGIKENEAYADSFIEISNAIGMMSGAFQGNSNSVEQWAISTFGNIAQMIVQLQSLATAQGVASAFAAPWPANIAAVASVVATVASIFSSLPKFEDGGIVGGNSYFGDKLLARVNSGEMILNRQQQATLLNMTAGGAEITLGVSRIQGADIYLSLSNYMKKTGKKL